MSGRCRAKPEQLSCKGLCELVPFADCARRLVNVPNYLSGAVTGLFGVPPTLVLDPRDSRAQAPQRLAGVSGPRPLGCSDGTLGWGALMCREPKQAFFSKGLCSDMTLGWSALMWGKSALKRRF